MHNIIHAIRHFSFENGSYDMLTLLSSLGLEKYYYYGGNRSQPIIVSNISSHAQNALDKLRKYYTKETALMAYEIMERDYKVLGFDFPFPEWM